MVDFLAEELGNYNIPVKEFNLAVTNMGDLAKAMVDPATVIIGSPTVLNAPHPTVSYALLLANLLKPKARFISVLGSYGWGGKMAEQIVANLPNLKLEVLPGVITKGHPLPADLDKVKALAQTIRDCHRQFQS
jgi:flavorubredoxin